MPLTYAVHETEEAGFRIAELVDPARDQRARILPEVGGTCFQYRVVHEGRHYDLLEPIDDLAALADHPTRGGTPILFPFPNRIRNGVWTWRGKTYEFEIKRAGGHHIHGLVCNRPWKIESLRSEPDKALCALTLDSGDFEDIERQYPFPFRLRVLYTLSGGELAMTFSAENTGNNTLPMGVGFHPYFAAPISPETSPSECLVRVPASGRWELANFLPTGAVKPVSGAFDLRDGQRMDALKLDDVYTDLAFDPQTGRSRCVVEDRGIRLRTVVESDRAFREMVLYTPPGRRSICFEPYTCPTDAPNLAAIGCDAGLIELEPGEMFVGTMRVRPEPLAP